MHQLHEFMQFKMQLLMTLVFLVPSFYPTFNIYSRQNIHYPKRKCITSNIRTPSVRVYFNHSCICFVVMLRNGESPFNFEIFSNYSWHFRCTYVKIKYFKHWKKEWNLVRKFQEAFHHFIPTKEVTILFLVDFCRFLQEGRQDPFFFVSIGISSLEGRVHFSLIC